MTRAKHIAIAIFALAGLVSGVAAAQTPPTQPAPAPTPSPTPAPTPAPAPAPLSQTESAQDVENLERAVELSTQEPQYLYGGTSLTFGGGAATFVEDEARDYSDTAGSWDLRIAFGTRLPVALEAAYIGSVSDINTLGLDSEALLVSNGAETGLRWNIIPDDMVQPYLMGGVAWRHYELAREEFNTSNVTEDDDTFEIPVAAGASIRYRQAIFDLRVSYRHSFDNDLIRPGVDGDDANLHTAAADVKVGFEF